MLKLGTLGFCLALGLGWMAGVQADDAQGILLYRYVDSRGVTVLDRQGVPPEYVGKGYEVLNQRGRVVQTIPPAPSADELRDAQAAKLQSEADAHLLRLYSSVEDVDRAKSRRLAELEGLIVVAQGNIQNLIAQQGSLQTQAADQERAGHPVAKTLLDQLDDLRDQQQNLKVDILRYQTARTQAESEFAQDRARLQKLLSR